MSPAAYALGLALHAAMVGPVAAGAFLLRRRLLPAWRGAPARLAEAVLAVSALVVVGELLGAVGWFRRGALVAAAAVAGLGTAVAAGRRPAASDPVGAPAVPNARPERATVVAVGLAALVAGQWALRSLNAALVGIVDNDSVYYHLPAAARFLQDGRVTGIHFTITDPLNAYFPANGELVHALLAVPFGRDLLSPYVNLLWLVLGLLAAWCIGLRFRAAPLCLAPVAVVFATPVMVRFEAGTGQVGIALLAALLAAVALVVHADGDLAGIAVAGLAAGLAVGTKYTTLAPVAVLTLVVVLLAPRARRLPAAVAWLVPMAATGAFWYVRNLVVVGNPVPGVGGLGPVRLPSPESITMERYGHAVADYAGDGWFWRSEVAGPLDVAFGWAWPVLLGVALAGTVVALVRGSRLARVLGLLAAVVFALYLVTPFTALGRVGEPFVEPNLRFLPPFLCLALVALVVAVGHRRRAHAWVLWACGLGGLVTAAASLRSAPALVRMAFPVAVVALGCLLALVARRPLPGRRLVAAAALGAVAVAVGGGWLVQDRAARHRYLEASGDDGGIWAWAQGLRDERIGVVGYMRNYPLHGPDLSNTVRYLGMETEHGGFTDIPDCRRFMAAVAAGRYGYVVAGPVKVTRLFDPQPEPEGDWLRAQPGAAQVVTSGAVAVFRLDPDRPPEPARCP